MDGKNFFTDRKHYFIPGGVIKGIDWGGNECIQVIVITDCPVTFPSLFRPSCTLGHIFGSIGLSIAFEGQWTFLRGNYFFDTPCLGKRFPGKLLTGYTSKVNRLASTPGSFSMILRVCSSEIRRKNTRNCPQCPLPD